MVDNGVIKSWKDVAAGGNAPLHENPAWASGKIAGTYQWDSTYGKISGPLEEGQQLVPVKLLQVEGAKTEGVYRKPSMLLAISKNSKEPKAAAEIVNCLLNDPEAIKILGATRGVPSSKVALDELTKAGSIKPVQVEANKIVLESNGVGVSPLNEHPRVTEAFDSTFEAFAYGQASAEDAAAEIIDGINSALTGIWRTILTDGPIQLLHLSSRTQPSRSRRTHICSPSTGRCPGCCSWVTARRSRPAARPRSCCPSTGSNRTMSTASRTAIGGITFRTADEKAMVDIRDHGARPDSKDNTKAIQSAIAAVPAGGTLRLPAGSWTSGPLFLKSNMTLLIEEGAVLQDIGTREGRRIFRPPSGRTRARHLGRGRGGLLCQPPDRHRLRKPHHLRQGCCGWRRRSWRLVDLAEGNPRWCPAPAHDLPVRLSKPDALRYHRPEFPVLDSPTPSFARTCWPWA